ncbi:hypothetical protein [Streptosporangium canum]|uniref:hypothetical protein n=1 Tax=Streptosporangium canum TaxID=324952 RepID=UPI00342C4721
MTVSQTASGSRTRTSSKAAASTGRKSTTRDTAESRPAARNVATRKTAARKTTARKVAEPKAAASKATESRTAEQATESGHAGQPHDGPSLTLNLPMMTVQFRPPHLHLPLHLPHVNRREAGQAVDVARSFLPPPERMVYYGGLGALAVAGLIEWPVAAAIGVGTVIAQRARGGRRPVASPRRTTTTSSHRTAASPRQPTAASSRAKAL